MVGVLSGTKLVIGCWTILEICSVGSLLVAVEGMERKIRIERERGRERGHCYMDEKLSPLCYVVIASMKRGMMFDTKENVFHGPIIYFAAQL